MRDARFSLSYPLPATLALLMHPHTYSRTQKIAQQKMFTRGLELVLGVRFVEVDMEMYIMIRTDLGIAH